MRSRLLPVLALCTTLSCGGRAPVTPAPEPEAKPAGDALDQSVEAALDRSVDPCEDFYAFACGGWMEANEIPADKPRTGRSFDAIADRNEATLHEILEGFAADPGDDPGAQQLGAYYRSCMDTEAIDAAGIAPIRPVLDAIDAVRDRKGLAEQILAIQVAGDSPFFDMYVSADDKNPTVNVTFAQQGGLSLPDRTYYVGDDETRKAKLVGYQAMLAKLFEKAGDTPEVAAKRAEQAVAVEVALAEPSWPVEDLYDPDKTYNRLDKKGLQPLIPSLDIGALFAAYGRPELSQIVVATPSYFEALNTVLEEHELEGLKSYLAAWVLSHNADLLSSDVDAIAFDFFGKELSGQQEQKVRWKRCVAQTDSMLGELLGQSYVDTAFAGDSKVVAVEMIEAIEAAFEKNLSDLAWMDDATRERAVEKARAVRNKIGYPDAWKDYSALEFGDVWFDNHVAAREHMIAWYLEQAERPVDKNQWFMSPPTVNAYYNPSGNEIVFPAGILQPPFYDADFPRAMNFGAIGMVMGHELTHGFDDTGAKYDPSGKLTDWWEPESVQRFEEATLCIQDQYGGFEALPGMFVNGELTLGENIADLGGIKQAHVAYVDWVAEHGEERSVAGFTGEQLLFLSFAQGWCTKATPEYQQMLLARDSHSPARFRVNGPLANYAAFGEAFECEVGSPMRPEETCAVW